jgi:hypothetical protein
MDESLKVGVKNVDPLTKGPDAAFVLFQAMAKEANKGFTRDDVIGAAANLILNALRQDCAKHKDADEALTRLLEKSRQALAEHYGPTGVRRSIFPHNQVIQVPTAILRK